VVSYFVIILGRFIIVKYVYPVPFEYGTIAKILALASSVYYLSTLVDLGLAASIAVKVGLVVLFVFGLFVFRVFRSKERTAAMRLLRKVTFREPA